MIYTVDESLRNFKFWGQAKDTAERLTCEQLDQIEAVIENCYCDDYPTDTAINDLFAYDDDFIFGTCLGWKKSPHGEYIDPEKIPFYADEATAENIEKVLYFAGVDRVTRYELGRIADDVNRAQFNDAEERPELAEYRPFTIEDFIDALEAVQDDGNADEVRDTRLFYMCDQAVRILLGSYSLLCESEIDFDEVRSVLYDD